MHFFYMDETGCTGADLNNGQQPIFVLGGLSVRDEGWVRTTEALQGAINDFFGGVVPPGFELHAHQLLATNGGGPFAGIPRERRNALATAILQILIDRQHGVHFVGIDKGRLAAAARAGDHAAFDARVPYLLGFNYLTSYIEQNVRPDLGRSARGMIILDVKDGYQPRIDAITHYRRFSVPRARRLKRVVEFSYPVDSQRHPMIQVSDLVIFLVRKFLEVENGYKPNTPQEAKDFFASCYAKIIERQRWRSVIEAVGPDERRATTVLRDAFATHHRGWQANYAVAA